MKKQYWMFPAKFLVTALLLTWIVHKANLPHLAQVLRTASLPMLLVPLSLNLVGLLLSALRWHYLLEAQSMRVPVLKLAQSYLVGMFFNFFLPGSIGGDVVRAYDVKKIHSSGTQSASVVIFERLTGVAILMGVGALVVFAQRSFAVPRSIEWFLCGGLAGLALLLAPLLLVSPGRAAGRIRRIIPPKAAADKVIILHQTFHRYRHHPRILGLTVLFSLLLQVNVGVYYWALGQALGLPVPMLYYFIAYPVAALLVMLPVTINGIGINENIWAFLLGSQGVGVEAALLFAWLHMAMLLVYAAFGGLVYLLRR